MRRHGDITKELELNGELEIFQIMRLCKTNFNLILKEVFESF